MYPSQRCLFVVGFRSDTYNHLDCMWLYVFSIFDAKTEDRDSWGTSLVAVLQIISLEGGHRHGATNGKSQAARPCDSGSCDHSGLWHLLSIRRCATANHLQNPAPTSFSRDVFDKRQIHQKDYRCQDDRNIYWSTRIYMLVNSFCQTQDHPT